MYKTSMELGPEDVPCTVSCYYPLNVAHRYVILPKIHFQISFNKSQLHNDIHIMSTCITHTLIHHITLMT